MAVAQLPHLDMRLTPLPQTRKPHHPLSKDTMLQYFLTQLEVRTIFVAGRIADDPQKKELLDVIREELSTFRDRHHDDHAYLNDEAWGHAYYIERLLALIEPRDTLIGEVKRRLDEAADEKVPTAGRLRTVFEAESQQLLDKAHSPPALKPDGESRLRAMLLEILEEIHWFYQRKFYSRPIQKSATRRLIWFGLIACGLFILPYVYLYLREWLSDSSYVVPFEDWPWLPLWTALTAGFFGAMFSRLLYLQTNWNNLSLGSLNDARDFSSILLRGAVGMTGAVVLYYFLLSGVMGGTVFPDFQKLQLHQLRVKDSTDDGVVPLRLILPNVHLALLVVWSFLAGFSERVVPNLLQSTEASLGESAGQRKSK